jgi:D-sedoheptulose 7-phosphate isomerase
MNLNQTVDAISKISNNDLDALLCLVNQASNVLLIGNGGSNAIASHISVDYIKFLNKQSIAFSDPAMLTAFMNDEGVQNAYSEFISKMSNKDTLVILISSSGNSQNIFNAAKFCVENNIKFVILTGFSKDNSVRSCFKDSAQLEYWVDSNSYGVVECVHQIFLHAIIKN